MCYKNKNFVNIKFIFKLELVPEIWDYEKIIVSNYTLIKYNG